MHFRKHCYLNGIFNSIKLKVMAYLTPPESNINERFVPIDFLLEQ